MSQKVATVLAGVALFRGNATIGVVAFGGSATIEMSGKWWKELKTPFHHYIDLYYFSFYLHVGETL